MLKVNYPQSAAERKQLLNRYLYCFVGRERMQEQFDKILKALGIRKNNIYTIDHVLTAPIEKLYDISVEINRRSANRPSQITALKKLFNYDKAQYGKKYQPDIANFFMSSPELNAATCYFCNIDHIYSFKLIGDYRDGTDLIKRAAKSELLKIKGITDTAAQKIINQRPGVQSLEDLEGLSAMQINNLQQLEPKGRNNLFTLDHVLDKASHPVAALSLFNFVPCCYSCNSKFKRSQKLVLKNTSISPTSKDFSFDKWVRFRLFFRGNASMTYRDINSINDFELNFEIDKDSDEYENYLQVFKLRTRYIFHKKEVLNLIRKRRAYSDSQIAEIARLTKRTATEIKRDIFGVELFDDNTDIKPLTKLKRDIAIDIGIRDAV
ncbi:MAG: hypothetical protein JNM19_16455 [Chitinophagaceae bacterium]|nr:hypothetical protein [Chitinophagaceae bacterium]